MEIIFATHNRHKSGEIKKMASQIAQIKDLSDIQFGDEVPENGLTLQANACEKAHFVYRKINQPAFADDTGLEVDTLNGEPGVFSARYAGTPKNDRANLQKLIAEMENKPVRTARFRTVICFYFDRKPVYFEGAVEGNIIYQPRGQAGFGYDPVFMPEGYNVTFAEMDLNLKNQISHRAKAFQKFINFLSQANF